ncbi:ARF GTPase-activating protein GIT1 isoform X1 [Lates japonicus]|uniref:ARF GTPase-activating protein GIT1 isoform X1 n=1 Tax=Lates japonicus TaxID=270547 RepID=A0AAD3MPD7_LATJO|nr:ARF GTPase-activating protein GIT1 isoform X1 [Lates japonicus]
MGPDAQIAKCVEDTQDKDKLITRMQTENSALRGGQQAGGAAGHGVGGPGGGGGPLARGCDARRNRWRGSGWVWARIGPPGALCALLSRPPLPSPPERPPGLLNVRARGAPGTTDHGPPALDSLAARLQPLNTPSVRKGSTGGPAPYGSQHLSGSTEMGRYMMRALTVS